MVRQSEDVAWSPEDEKRLLLALEDFGMGKWEEVTARVHGKTLEEVKTHFELNYPQRPTHHVIGPIENIFSNVDQNSTREGDVITARWFVRIRATRAIPPGGNMGFEIPQTFTERSIEKYKDKKGYEGDGVVVFILIWCIAAKLGGETIVSRIPVWTLPEEPIS